MLNYGMEPTYLLQGTLDLTTSQNQKSRHCMYKKFHGVDLHKRYASISTRNIDGEEINYNSECSRLRSFVDSLTPEDLVILKSVNNPFYWADEIEFKGAGCVIIDPYKFKIISESLFKTVKRDAKSLSLALWITTVHQEFSLPEIYKPKPEIRELRKLFSQYMMLNMQTVQYKNSIQATLCESGIALDDPVKEKLFDPQNGLEIFKTLELSPSARICIIMNIYLLWNLYDQKEILKREMYKAGKPLKDNMMLLITIKGVSPFLALAFLADVCEVTRLKNVRQLNSCLGTVPTIHASGAKSRIGGINRHSRNLTRTLFTQCVWHFANSSPEMFKLYSDLKSRRGAGRARIALLRHLFIIMRTMLLTGE
jgi:transposase